MQVLNVGGFEKQGELRGELRGKEQGLRLGIEAVCQVLGIELTEERHREMTGLDAVRLNTLLLEQIQQKKSWG
jgi:hypothetical protein